MFPASIVWSLPSLYAADIADNNWVSLPLIILFSYDLDLPTDCE